MRPSIAKPRPPARSPSYLAFVREHPCACCGKEGPSDADHVGPRGVGQKTADWRCIPLCRDCHRFRTDNGYLPVSVPDWGRMSVPRARAPREYVAAAERHSRLLVAEAQRELLVEWLSRKAER